MTIDSRFAPFGGEAAEQAAPEVLFERRGGVGFVLLNRPSALNALSLSLIEAFDARLEAWATNPAV